MEAFYLFLNENDEDLSENLHNKLDGLYNNLDDAAEDLEGRITEFEEVNADLLAASKKALEFMNSIMSHYGTNLKVLNYHLNGDAEPWDNFFDENMYGNERELLRNAIEKAENEK
jgi:hypothetical protein